MKNETQNKMTRLVHETRVMTLAVSKQGVPWSSPVYYVFHDNKFYFFSNEHSNHIRYAGNGNIIAASIFQDADRMDEIFGCQMTGTIDVVSKISVYFLIVKKYVTKFSFLTQIFGAQVIDNKHFFLEKFKSRLYCFSPEKLFLSDNSRASDKRIEVDLNNII